MLFTSELKIAADEDEHATSGAGRLAIDSANGVLTLLEGEASKLGDNIRRALDLLTFKRQHRSVLVEISKTSSIGVKGRVIMIDECLSHRVGIHSDKVEIRRWERDNKNPLSSAPLGNDAEFRREGNGDDSVSRGFAKGEGLIGYL